MMPRDERRVQTMQTVQTLSVVQTMQFGQPRQGLNVFVKDASSSTRHLLYIISYSYSYHHRYNLQYEASRGRPAEMHWTNDFSLNIICHVVRTWTDSQVRERSHQTRRQNWRPCGEDRRTDRQPDGRTGKRRVEMV